MTFKLCRVCFLVALGSAAYLCLWMTYWCTTLLRNFSVPAPAVVPGVAPVYHFQPRNSGSKAQDRGTTGKPRKPRRIVIIGSGPTALGAAKRLYDLGQGRNNSVIITILEELDKPGGLASSVRDDKGFLWDVGVHVVFSHYTYFDRVLNMAVPEWNYRRRVSFVFMKGSDQNKRFVPNPLLNKTHTMGRIHQQKNLTELEKNIEHPITRKIANLDERILREFGGITEVYKRKLNRKIWTEDTKQTNSFLDGEMIKHDSKRNKANNSEWELDRFFRFPKCNGTGGIWESVARLLPHNWIRFHEKVTSIDIDRKLISVKRGNANKSNYILGYDALISTIPLDILTGIILKGHGSSLEQMQKLASQLVYTHTHIVGVGLTGQLPKNLADKSRVYFPNSDSPFYHITVFYNYSDDHVPKEGPYWSLMCEIAEPQKSSNPAYWKRENLIQESINALVLYGFITADMVVSRHYRRLDHGYPVPSLTRDMILDTIQPWLKSKGIYSRGLLGGWRYEIGEQDHSFMQGVEAADYILKAIPEETYNNPHLVNSRKNTGRVIPLNYEIVIAHYKENLDWLKPYANHTLVYHHGNDLGPPFQLYHWERLKNVGRESQPYLYHITTFYYTLADVTVFAQADSLRGRCFKDLLRFVESAKKGVPCLKIPGRLTYWGNINFSNNLRKKVRKANETLGQVYRHLYGHVPPTKGIESCRNGCFGATKPQIQRHPLEFYQKALAYVSNHPCPEEGHYMERLWYHILVGDETTFKTDSPVNNKTD